MAKNKIRINENELKQIVAVSVKNALNDEISDHKWVLSYVYNILTTIHLQIEDIVKLYVDSNSPGFIDYLTDEIEERGRMFSGLLHSIMKKHWINRKNSKY